MTAGSWCWPGVVLYVFCEAGAVALHSLSHEGLATPSWQEKNTSNILPRLLPRNHASAQDLGGSGCGRIATELHMAKRLCLPASLSAQPIVPQHVTNNGDS
jgi:hypothetical protein